MIGAIIGDIVGSIYEWDNIKTKDFKLFDEDCDFTDDTVMTLAVAKALVEWNRDGSLYSLKEKIIDVMHEYGKRYPDCGFGGHFTDWIINKKRKPYGSYGNGSAMRVSFVGWFSNSLLEAELLAKVSTEITHNHPDGIKGAQAVASAIYLARTGKSIVEIKEYIKNKYYDINFTLDEIRPTYKFDVTCKGSVPQALEAFFESENFEDAIRNAISIGGDSDTIASITGSIAEAYYGVDEDTIKMALSYLDDDLLNDYCKIKNKMRGV